jgi:hypothetical protein
MALPLFILGSRPNCPLIWCAKLQLLQENLCCQRLNIFKPVNLGSGDSTKIQFGNAIRQPHDLLATVNRIFQRWILTPARELPLDLPDACSVTQSQPFERWI